MSILWIITLFLSVSVSMAQIKIKSLDEKLPSDSKVKVGKLSNGIVYYLRENKKPENRLELRLAIKAGSVLEEENQKGLAHFVEHMCFNGTKNFPKNELIKYLESTGMRFGADLNAYTSFDETVYMLQLPTDNADALKNG
ncbi:MAG: insulinase family protein, partial [Bacteroidales bacterium]|nr:insulinase family protein [Bacteroidales bacterium]